ncbi:hypothetical protein B9Z55_007208 [Caenorhabditis nigoni]|uniref:BHLH domain-containing protein n=1 Tax=Caenorhabditis nigoni TaxID=1611254 RepID=A0A2G5V8W4_9PELO|nr:hypothetical protein B9Z55_007208 [Caenorhabditis nigoni]
MPPRKENAKKKFTESQRARKNAYEQARKAKKNGPMEQLKQLTRHLFSSDYQPERAVIEQATRYIAHLRRMLAESEPAQETTQMEMDAFDPEQAAYEMFGMSQPTSTALRVSPPTLAVPNATVTSSEVVYNQWNEYSPSSSNAQNDTPPAVILPNTSSSADGVYNGSVSPPTVFSNTATSSDAAYNQWDGYQEQQNPMFEPSPPSIAQSATPPDVVFSNNATSSEAAQWNGYQEQQQYYYQPAQVDPQQEYTQFLMSGGQYY